MRGEVGRASMSKPRGLYTPVYQSLTTHRKTNRAATELKCHRLKLVGHLVALWTWSLGNVPGDGGPLTAADIAFAAEWPERSAEKFARALLDCGFLDAGDGGYYLHEWDLYGGKVAETAAKDRARKGGSSPEIPRNPAGIPTLDETETRREEDETRSSVSLAREQEELRVYLHVEVGRQVLKGTTAPDSDWCIDLIQRGLTRSDVDHAIQGAIANVPTLPYTRKILLRRVEERENGIDHDQLARDRAANAARGNDRRADGRARGVVGVRQSAESLAGFGDAPAGSVRADADHAETATGDPGAGAPIRFPGRDRASGGAR